MKKKKTQKQSFLSPEKYIRERARLLPIGKCWCSKNWRSEGLVQIIVTRTHKTGNITWGCFLVDMFCLGVKDAMWQFNTDDSALRQFMENTPAELVETSYNEVHNMLFGAIEFAEEAGVMPCKEWNIAKFILEEDTDAIPLIDYPYGQDGEHFFVATTRDQWRKYSPVLKKNLGPDFKYIILKDDYESDFNPRDWNDDVCVTEPYSYVHPEYPSELNLHHPELLNTFTAEDNNLALDPATVEEILKLPNDELKEDLERCLLCAMSQGKDLTEDMGYAAYHASVILSEVGDNGSFDILIELLRHDSDFCEMIVGDAAPIILVPTIAKLGRGHLDKMLSFMKEPGLDSINRALVAEAVRLMSNIYPEDREKQINWFRSILNFYVTALPECKGCDSDSAAFVVGNVVDAGFAELEPEIRKLFATGMVRESICGDLDEVISDLRSDYHHASTLKALDVNYRYSEVIRIFGGE